jgi:hypothetical protein
VNACADANPKRNEKASEADQANGNTARLQAYSPQSCHKGVNGEKLMRCTSVSSQTQKTRGEETHKGDQGNSKFTDLLNDALRCAIMPCGHDPLVRPPDIENTAHALQKVEHEKGELSRKFKIQ